MPDVSPKIFGDSPNKSHRPSLMNRIALGAATSLGISALLLLAGCAPETSGNASGKDSSSPSAIEPASASVTPSSEPTPTDPPYVVACDTLLTAQDIYDFNPNFTATTEHTATIDAVKTIATKNGTTCAWTNQTSGEVIEVGVAKLLTTSLASAKGDAATHSTAVPTYGTPPDVEGFFTRSGNTGTAQLFLADGAWIVIGSSAFFEPGDAQQLVQTLTERLKA